MNLGRWVVWGWAILLIIIVGGVIGFMLYTRLVIGIKLHKQPAMLMLPPSLVVKTKPTEMASLSLKGQVDVEVPFKNPALPLPLQGTYKTNLAIDTMVPLRMTIVYEDVIPVKTVVHIDADTGLAFKWLPRFPLVGDVPVELSLPVKLTVPVDTQIRFQYEGPVLVTLDQTIHPPVDTILSTSIVLNEDIEAPVTNVFDAEVLPKDLGLPVILTDTRLDLPLQNLKLTTASADAERELEQQAQSQGESQVSMSSGAHCDLGQLWAADLICSPK